jgi:hypothetical protein
MATRRDQSLEITKPTREQVAKVLMGGGAALFMISFILILTFEGNRQRARDEDRPDETIAKHAKSRNIATGTLACGLAGSSVGFVLYTT